MAPNDPGVPAFDAARRASATSAIPATSCGSSLWGGRHARARRRSSGSAPTPSDGRDDDLGRVAGQVPRSPASCCSRSCRSRPSLVPARRRRSSLVVPAALAAPRAARARRRGRRRGSGVVLDARAGPARPAARRGRPSGTWIASTRFPSLPYLAGAAAAPMVGKPWLSRSWRRAGDLALAGLVAGAGDRRHRGVPELLLARGRRRRRRRGAAGRLRRPEPAAHTGGGRRRARGPAGFASRAPDPASGPRADARSSTTRDASDGEPLVRQGVRPRQPRRRPALPRLPHAPPARTERRWPSTTLGQDVEHEGFLLMLARRGGVRCPRVAAADPACATAPSPSRSSTSTAAASTSSTPDRDRRRLCSTRCGGRSQLLHDAGSRTGRCGPPTSSSSADGPVLIDLGFGEESATPRMQAIDRAELLASMAALVGPSARSPPRPGCSAGRSRDDASRSCSRSRCRPRPAGRRRSRCWTSCGTGRRGHRRGACRRSSAWSGSGRARS